MYIAVQGPVVCHHFRLFFIVSSWGSIAFHFHIASFWLVEAVLIAAFSLYEYPGAVYFISGIRGQANDFEFTIEVLL